MSKRYDEPVEVEGPTPLAFVWRGRRYHVDRLLKRWLEAGEGWDPERSHDREYFRVEAAGGTYDLLYDRQAGRDRPRWRLRRVWD